MGVLTDYFRAPSVAAVQEEMTRRDGGPLFCAGTGPAFDGVELKHVDPSVVLGQLVAFATGTAWDPDLVKDRLIWPEGGEHDTEYQGPWVVVIDDRTRDTLAGVPAQRMTDLVRRWAGIEEWDGLADADNLPETVEQLTALAARARDSGESLYCWMSV